MLLLLLWGLRSLWWWRDMNLRSLLYFVLRMLLGWLSVALLSVALLRVALLRVALLRGLI